MIRNDDWQRVQGGLGSIYDKSEGLSFGRRTRLHRTQLDALYCQNSIAARVVDRIVNDAFREGWELGDVESEEEVDPKQIRKRLDEELGGAKYTLDQIVARSAKWSRLYGSTLLLLPTTDALQHTHLPLIAPTKIFPLVPVIGDFARPLTYDEAFGSKTFQQVLSYQISGTLSTTLEVHHSRVIPLEAIDLPPEALRGSGGTGWGPSVLERVFDDLARAGASRKHAVAMMFVASLLSVQLDGWAADVKANPEKAREWLQTFAQRLAATGVVALDKNDTLTLLQRTLSGGHELIDKMHDALAAAADMPREILFNESPAGLNAGELSGPQALWFANVAAYQKEVLTPVLRRILAVAFEAWKLPIHSFEIQWKPLWTKSEEKTAATAKTNAETDLINVNLGVYSEAEVRRHRVERGRMDPVEVDAGDEQPVALDLSLAPDDVAAQTTAQAGEPPAPQDEALNGAQIASLLDIVARVNAGEIPRDAAIEIVRVSFPRVANPASVLGSAGVPDPAAVPDVGEAGPSTEPPPDDLVSPREAGLRFGVPTATISARMRAGELSWWGLGAQRRVSLAEVATLAKSHEQPTPESEPIP